MMRSLTGEERLQGMARTWGLPCCNWKTGPSAVGTIGTPIMVGGLRRSRQDSLASGCRG